VALSGGVRTSMVTVPFAFSGGLSNAEYAITTPGSIADDATGGAVTFAVDGMETAGDSATIVVNLQGDNLNEATETLTVTLSSPGGTPAPDLASRRDLGGGANHRQRPDYLHRHARYAGQRQPERRRVAVIYDYPKRRRL